MLHLPFQKLQVWVKAMQLAKNVYTLTSAFPKEELYGMTSQIRRAAISIPSNIAEGSQRTTDRDFQHFILIAKGSLAELYTQLLLAQELRYITQKDVENIERYITELDKMLYALHKKLTATR